MSGYAMKKKSLIVIVAISALVFLYIGVILLLEDASKIEPSILVGKYQGVYTGFAIGSDLSKDIYNNGTHSLELRADSTYVYRNLSKDGEETTSEGRWQLHKNKGRWMITFFDFPLGKISVTVGTVDDERKGVFSRFVTREPWQEPRISIDYDVCFYFIKQSDHEGVSSGIEDGYFLYGRFLHYAMRSIASVEMTLV